MKLIHKIFAAAASILALSSCVESAIEDMTGKYEKPAVHEMNTLVSQSVEKGEKTRTFTVEIAGDNASLTMVMVGDKYFLADGSYTPAPADQAKKNTYIVGNGGTTFNNIPVETGSIKVTQGEGTYSFAGILWLADESVIEVKSTVALVYEADPEPVVMKKVASTRNNVKDGGKTVTINLATPDVKKFEFDWVTWSGFLAEGTGQVFSLDLYSTDGYMHEGTYTAGDSNALAEGQFGTTYSLFGMVPNHGTCLWDVNDGVPTPTAITAGTVTVARKGNKWVIEYICGEGKDMIWVKFEGAIDDLTDPSLLGGGEVEEPFEGETVDNLLNVINYYQQYQGYSNTLALILSTEGVTAVDMTYWYEYKGNGNYLQLEVFTTDGKLAAGTYEVGGENGAFTEGQFNAGYFNSQYNSASGTFWATVENDVATPEYITDGTVEIKVSGENVIITLKSNTVNVQYTGTIDDFKAMGLEVVNLNGDDDEAESFDGETVDNLLNVINYYQQYQGYSNTLALILSTEGVTAVDMTYWYEYKGNGNYLQLEVFTTDGKLAAGTYEVGGENGAFTEGQFNAGYFNSQYNSASGTFWATVENDVATPEYITDGTVEIEVSGDTVTITLISETVNVKYVGSVADLNAKGLEIA